MDVGALTVFMHTFTQREKVYNLAERLTGARFTTSYTRVGGQTRDLPHGWLDGVRKFCDEVSVAIDESDKLLTRNRIWVDRTKDVGIISAQDAIDFGNVVKRGLELLRNDAVLHGLPSDGSPVVTITDIGT
jgi:NADH-quinone oxidoreductase subunit D